MARKDPLARTLGAGGAKYSSQLAKFDKPEYDEAGKLKKVYIKPGESVYQAATRLKIDPRLLYTAGSKTGEGLTGSLSPSDFLGKSLTYGGILGDFREGELGGSPFISKDGKFYAQKSGMTSGYMGYAADAAWEKGYQDRFEEVSLGEYIEPDNLAELLQQPMFGGSGRPAYSNIGPSLSGQAPALSSQGMSRRTGAYQDPTRAQVGGTRPETQQLQSAWGTAGQFNNTPAQIVSKSDPRYQQFIQQGYREDPNYVSTGGDTVRLIQGGTRQSSYDKYFNAPAAGAVVSSDSARGGIDAMTEDVALQAEDQQEIELSNQVYDGMIEALQPEHDEQVAQINATRDPQRQARGEQNEAEMVGAQSRSQSYLGGSQSQTGIILNLAKSQRREMNLMETQRQFLLRDVQQHIKDREYQLAADKLDAAQDIRDRIAQQREDFIAEMTKYEKEQQAAAEKQAKAARDAFEFALDHNIQQPYYTLDGNTIWDSATGEMVADPSLIGDPNLVQIVEPEAEEIEFETRTVNKEIIRFGFDAEGNIVSRTVLGKSTTGGSSGSGGGVVSGVRLTKTEQGYFNQIQDGEIELSDVPASAYTAVKKAIDAQTPAEEPEEGDTDARVTTRQQWLESGSEYQKAAAVLDQAKEEGWFTDEVYEEIYQALRSETRDAMAQSRLNKALEKLENL